jgi:hypothetical protein
MCFRADFPTLTCQFCSELIEGVVLSATDFGPAFLYVPKLAWGGGVDREGAASAEVRPERLTDEFGTGSMFGLPDCLDLADHRWGQ